MRSAMDIESDRAAAIIAKAALGRPCALFFGNSLNIEGMALGGYC